MNIPSIFVSHGAPTLVTDSGRTADFFRALGGQLPRPRAILCVSAHWETAQPALTGNPQPPTIHDFYGFPQNLYDLHYNAPGDPALAARAAELLAAAGFSASVHPQRGLDHGAWVPLMLSYPQADVPVVQLSVQPQRDARHHYELGRALRPLRDDGVLVFASGAATHNLREFRGQPMNAAPPAYVLDFEAWLTDAVTSGNVDALLDYAARAPHATRNHPTPEHFLPLFVALGAAADPKAQVLHQNFNYGILSMAAYSWN
jgi:4,5-DOPA dioxygenase extradiol